MTTAGLAPLAPLVGDGALVPCVDGQQRPYLSCDAAASTPAFPSVLAAVEEFLPWYSSVHRGAGYKSQRSTDAYEGARDAVLRFARRQGGDDVAIICRNTTEAINHLAYRLQLSADDVVVTTVVEHHANLLPWSRAARCRYVECGRDGTFGPDDVAAALDARPAPRLLAVTGASNITGWPPRWTRWWAWRMTGACPLWSTPLNWPRTARCHPGPISSPGAATRCTRPLEPGPTAPRRLFAEGDPFLVGGGAVELVELDHVLWTEPPDREEAGSPNVVGAVALAAAVDQFDALGWPAVTAHDKQLASALRKGLSAIPGVRLLGPELGTETLPVATFTVDGLPHSLVAARLAFEDAIGVRHGCFCAHPYLVRLLGLGPGEVAGHRLRVRLGDRSQMPGAVRASLGVNASGGDVERLCLAVARLAALGRRPSLTPRTRGRATSAQARQQRPG